MIHPAPSVSLTHRERLLLRLVRQSGPVTRSDLIRLSGLGGVPVFRATEDMARAGLVEIGDAIAKGRGQPSAVITLRADHVFSVGLSVMTDAAEAVLMDFSGQVRARTDLSCDDMRMDTILTALDAFIEGETTRIGVTRERICGLGVSVAGFFVGITDQVNPPAELNDWALIDLKTRIEAVVRLPVTVENSASAAAVGEYVLGIGSDIQTFAYFNLTAGFGSGIILNGELWRGRHGNAGEIGLPGILGLPYAGLITLRDQLRDNGIHFDSVTEMLDGYDDSWPTLDAWIESRAPTFQLVANACRYVLDIDAIVIGGRAPAALARRVANCLVWHESIEPPRRGVGMPAPDVHVARLSGISAAIGAATLPLKAIYFA